MSISPCPVEEWAPIFTSAFTDEQILRPGYALNDERTWCKLCDAPLPKELLHSKGWKAHLRQHAHELQVWRKRKQVEAKRKRESALALVRGERALLAKTTGGVSPERRLANRVTSARYKLKHPERFGRKSWPEPELEKLRLALDEAQAALERFKRERTL